MVIWPKFYHFHFVSSLYVLTMLTHGPDEAITVLVVVVDLGFMMLLTSQIISVAFYSEREKSNKFCSEALILA